MIAKSWRWLVIGAVVVAVLTVAPWATKRVQACGGIGLFSINCDGIIIANQMVQIGHMVSQIAAMANQLRSMDGVLEHDDGVDQQRRSGNGKPRPRAGHDG